jgi:cis-L-3-hydroxyproline dehydratase
MDGTPAAACAPKVPAAIEGYARALQRERISAWGWGPAASGKKLTLTLTERDRAMLNGDRGPAAQLAMSILVRMAGVYGATELMDISQAHIDSTIYLGDATLEFAERLASLGARVAVPTSLNVSGVDECGWKDWAVSPEWAAKAARQMLAYEKMGAVPTWTCAPYQTQMRPSFGQQIAWGESNAIAFANSVIGARTERYPDLLDICCAITGRVPAVGLHVTEHRAAEMLVRLVDAPTALQQDDQFFAVLGHLVGKLAGDLIPVIDGVIATPTEDQLKAFSAAVSSSGRVALFHIVGITPEAPTLEAALQGAVPQSTHEVRVADLRAARAELTTADGRQLDMVILGSPHFSLAEFRQLAPLVAGKRADPRVRFLITSSRLMKEMAGEAGVLAPILDFGAQITLDTCILASPMLPPEIKTLMTNSPKYAYYAPSLLNTSVTFGSLADCVRSAVEGRVVRDDSVWQTA